MSAWQLSGTMTTCSPYHLLSWHTKWPNTLSTSWQWRRRLYVPQKGRSRLPNHTASQSTYAEHQHNWCSEKIPAAAFRNKETNHLILLEQGKAGGAWREPVASESATDGCTCRQRQPWWGGSRPAEWPSSLRQLKLLRRSKRR